MKRAFILFLFCCVVCSCGSIARSRITTVVFTDFRSYLAKDFWISPDPYIGKFEPIGELYIYIKPGIIKKEDKTWSSSIWEDEQNEYTSYSYFQETIDTSELLELAYKEAKDKGANGIVNFKTKIETITTTDRLQSKTVIDSYIISGYLIKRIQD